MAPSKALHPSMIAARTMLILAAGNPAMADESAWQAPQQGGHVVLMRHTSPEQNGC